MCGGRVAPETRNKLAVVKLPSYRGIFRVRLRHLHQAALARIRNRRGAYEPVRQNRFNKYPGIDDFILWRRDINAETPRLSGEAATKEKRPPMDTD